MKEKSIRYPGNETELAAIAQYHCSIFCDFHISWNAGFEFCHLSGCRGIGERDWWNSTGEYRLFGKKAGLHATELCLFALLFVAGQLARESYMDTDTDNLIKCAANGEALARAELLGRYRDRLKKMIAVRMDPRLAGRIDASDVVQETLMVADKRLDMFLADPCIPFYAWLRSMAFDRLADLYRRHVIAQRRSITREHHWMLAMSDASAILLAEQLPGANSTPSQHMMREEMHGRIKKLLSEMAASDREIIIMRHLEGMKVSEIATVLQMPEGTVKSRHFRALTEMRRILIEE